MKTNWIEEIKNAPLFSYEEYMADALAVSADTKMRPGFAAILYQPARADIAQLHQALSVKAGIDWIEDLDRIPAYVIYQDTRGHLHQLYSLLEKPAAQEGMYPFENLCAPTYKKSVGGALSKIQEYYGGQIVESCLPKNIQSQGHCHIERTSTASATTVSVGLDLNLSGSYSYSSTNGHTVSTSGGLSIKNNRSYTVSDVTVSNRSDGTAPKAEWCYDFKRTACHFSFFSYGQVDLEDCALSARNTFVTESEWIFHVSRDAVSGNELQLEASSSVVLVSSRARLDYPCHTACVHRTKDETKSVTLQIIKPPIPSEQG